MAVSPQKLALLVLALRETEYVAVYPEGPRYVDGKCVEPTYRRGHYEDVYRALGMTDAQINSRSIPKGMDKTVTVNGNQWKVIPATGSYSAHRLFVLCAVCNEWIPGGRIHQHIPVHEIEAGFAERVVLDDGSKSRRRLKFLNGYERG